MGIATGFHDYGRLGAPSGVGGRCSPALKHLASATSRRYGTTNLGCYGVRPIRGGEVPSTHSFGAAIDLGTASLAEEVRNHLIGYLVGNSSGWGIQAIHDYRGSRIWRAGRTSRADEACTKWWRAQRPDSNGMGQPWAHWLHVEVHPTSWAADWTEAQRGIS